MTDVKYYSVLDSYMRIKGAREQSKLNEQSILINQQNLEAAKLEQQWAMEDRAAQQQAAQKQAQTEEQQQRAKLFASAIRNEQFDVLGQNIDVLANALGKSPDDPSIQGLLDGFQDDNERQAAMKVADFFDPEGAEQPYTLSEGAERRKGSQVIASNPKEFAPQTPQAAYSMSGGNRLNKFTGEVTPVTELGGVAAPEGEGDQRDRKIADLQTEFGLSKKDAVGITDGIVDMEINEKNGVIVLTNKADGTAREVKLKSADPERKPIEAKDTLWELAPFATGIKSGAQAAINIPLSMAGIPHDKQVSRARTRLRTEQQTLIRSLVLNPRFAASEMERVRKETDIEPKLFDTPELLRDRMVAVRDTLEQRRRDALLDASNPNNPVDVRASQATNAIYIENYLNILGVPENPDASSDPELDAILEKYGG